MVSSMDLWIKEAMNKLDRKKAQILFSEHAAKDKNLDMGDVDNAINAVQIGKVDKEKSTEEKKRICFKNYFDKERQTYFVVAEYYPDFIKVITVNKKKGKY